MKKILIYTSLLINGLLFSTCKKEAEQKKNMFSGSARLQGTVYFQNLITGTVDTAKKAILTITKQDADASDYYLVDLTNGQYDLASLSGGIYNFSVSYSVQLTGTATRLTYAQNFQVSVTDGQITPHNDLTLSKVTTSKTIFILKIVDVNDAPVTNAQISLYTDTLALRQSQSSGTGSSRSAVSNAAGLAVFADMQNAKYFAAVYTAANSDTTSNWIKASITPYGPFASNTVDTASVQILANKPTLSVTVVDQNNSLVSGAQVYVYSDLSLITQYLYLGTGSLRGNLTNTSGNALFTNLQTLQYYISASKVVGSVTLYNSTTILKPTAILKSGTLNSVRVTIK